MRTLIPGLISAFLMSCILLAQDLVPPSGDPGDAADDQATIVVDVDAVRVPFTVRDDDGNLVTGLSREDFYILEDRWSQQIQSFDTETELPLTVVLAMDTSGSVRQKLEFEQEAAIEFFYSVIERNRDQGMLVTFDSMVQVLQDFTDSPELLSEAVREIRVGGTSAMYDAIYLAVAHKLTGESAARRVMIVISDGDDNDSQMTLQDVLDIAQRNDVVVYAISTNGTAEFGAERQIRGDRLLDMLAEDTGGRAFYPLELSELSESLENISEELRSTYVATYVSTNTVRDGSYREIEVRPVDGDLEVHARRGYYAPTD